MDSPHLLDRARAYLAAGKPDRAAAISDVYIRDIDPKNPEAHGILSRATSQLGDHKVAIVHAGFAVAMARNDMQARAHLRTVLGRLANNPATLPMAAAGVPQLLGMMQRGASKAAAKPVGSTTGKIDLFLTMRHPNGSELHTIEIARRLRKHVETRIWTDEPPGPALLELDPTITTIGPGTVPTGDTLAIMAMFPKFGPWMRQMRARRIILHFNVFDIPGLLRWLGAAKQSPAQTIDILFASKALGDILGIDGTMLPSPIDTRRFSPRGAIASVDVVGRMSRDAATKHHPQERLVYQALLDRGYGVRILGGTDIAPFMARHDRLTVYPAHGFPAVEFLHGLDLFYYRTGLSFEAWGRVITEAMACGLPVVAHRAGGYAEIIRHGENGFLFDTSDEAMALIEELKGDAPRIKRIGEAARQTVLDLFTPEADERIVEYFLRG